MAHENSHGGQVAVNRAYLEEVPDCELFRGWGWEDELRIHIASKLDRNPRALSDKKAFFNHLPHPGSVRQDHPWYQRNQALCKFGMSLEPDQIRQFIETWK